MLLFGGSGKISSIMGDVAKGIKSFKKGMAEDDEIAKKEEPPKALDAHTKPWRAGRGQQVRVELQGLSSEFRRLPGAGGRLRRGTWSAPFSRH